jgi:hypothetical protein
VSLKPALAKVIRHRFTNCGTGSEGFHQRLDSTAHRWLSDAEFKALMDAGLATRDYHPVGDEQ